MTDGIALTPAQPERIPGDFHRNAKKAPRVAHPTKRTKDGKRPTWVYYGRPSGLGKEIGNGFLLSKYQQRMVALGMAADPSLIEQALAWVGKTNDDEGFREAMDDIATRAADAAKAGLAADRGTHVHALTEDHDTDGDPIARMERGESLGLPAEAQRALVLAWSQFLEHWGLEVLATEAKMVHDGLRVAGTLDRIVRATRDINVETAGRYEHISAGTVFVLDVKTGKLRLDEKTGSPKWWHDYAIQIHAYASGVPYDAETDERGEWPWPVDQNVAAICHLDVRAALAGEAKATFVTVDLRGGQVGADLVQEVGNWEARTDLFAVGETIGVPVEQPAEIAAPSTEGTPPPFDAPVAAVAEVTPSTTSATPSTDGPPPFDAPSSVPPAGSDTPADPVPTMPVGRAEQLAQVPDRLTIDEGDDAHPLEVDTWRESYERLLAENPAAASWIGELGNQAQHIRRSFHMGGPNPIRTDRRLSIMAGLVRMARAGADDDETLRSLLALTFDEDWPFFAHVRPGAALGLLDAAEAAIFAAHADALSDGRLIAAGVTPDGNHVRLRPAA